MKGRTAAVTDRRGLRGAMLEVVAVGVAFLRTGGTRGGVRIAASMALAPAAAAGARFIAGTEVRVRAEDRLLASRFGEEFERYRRSVPAYLPPVR